MNEFPASSLLKKEVVSEQGDVLGRVHDLRLVRDSSARSPLTGVRLHGMVVGKRAAGSRLGYLRGEVAGPWLLNKLFGDRGHEALYVEWADVLEIQPRRVIVRSWQ